MKKDSSIPTSQDYDRKHQQDHISSNPRTKKDLPNADDSETDADSGTTDADQKTDDIIAKGHAISNKIPLKPEHSIDKRDLARQEHTNHFTNRASGDKK